MAVIRPNCRPPAAAQVPCPAGGRFKAGPSGQAEHHKGGKRSAENSARDLATKVRNMPLALIKHSVLSCSTCTGGRLRGRGQVGLAAVQSLGLV